MLIAFIGLGTMGAPIAGHLAKAGHRLVVHDRLVERAADWADTFDGHLAATPAAAAMGAEAVVVCVGSGEALAAVLNGADGVLAAMHAGALLVVHTTASPMEARRLAAEQETRGVLVVDAPLAGDRARAERGELTVPCGGSDDAVAQAAALINCYAREVIHAGAAGAGQRARLAGRVAMAGALRGLAEARRLGGVETAMLEAMLAADGPGGGFAVDAMRHDLGLVLDEARSMGAALPMTAMVDGFYAEMQAMGDGCRGVSEAGMRA